MRGKLGWKYQLRATDYDLYRHRKYKYRKIVDKLKASVACADCRRHYPPEAMDFDHVPERGPKNFSISWAVNLGAVSPEYLIAEIKKCDLVCASCHRTRTKNRKRKSE